MACKNQKSQFPKNFHIQKESNIKKFKGYSNFALTFDSHMTNFPIVLSDFFGFSSNNVDLKVRQQLKFTLGLSNTYKLMFAIGSSMKKKGCETGFFFNF
jgi:hypothetical protein